MLASLLQVLANLLLFVVPNLGLGWWLARRAPLATVERLWLAVVAGLTLTGTAVFLGYALQAPVAVNLVPLALGALCLLPAWRELRRAPWTAADRAVLSATGLTAVVVLAALSWIRHYSGGGWAADWVEHLQRAQLFAAHGPADTLFFDFYTVPARPPLWNAYLAAHFTLLGPSFISSQLQVALAAALIVPPLWMLVRHAGGSTRAGWIVTLFVALNPSFVQNATFAWTRSPTVAITLGGLVLLARARRLNDGSSVLRVIAFALLAAATFMHYSAGPWLVVAGLIQLWDRRRAYGQAATWREVGGIALAGLLLLGPWLWWSTVTYGAAGTAASTTTVMGATQTGAGGQVRIIVANLFDTILPWFLRLPWSAWEARPESGLGNLHDMTFILYQTNLWFVIGTVGTVALLADCWRRRQRDGGADRGFWMALIGGGCVLGIAVNGTRELWGLTHICLQPVIYLALVAIALGMARWSRAWRRAVWIGFGVDVALGTVLHLALQSRDLLPKVAELSREAFRAEYGVAAHANLYYKVTSLSLYLGDDLVWLRPLTLALGLGAVLILVRFVRRPA